MKVLLVGNYVNDGQESMQKFAEFMEQGLPKAGHEVRLVRPPSIVGQSRSSGQGIGKWLIGVIVDHPRLPGLRRWILATKGAHGLYAQYGFKPLHAPERFMERFAG